MSDTEKQSVLARITSSARSERKAKAVTLQKALRLTIAKIADALMDLPMAVLSVSTQDIVGEEVEASLNDDQLQMIFDGPKGCVGAVLVEPVVVGALIQQQTLGSVNEGPDPERAMTRTDAAICAPLMDTLFERLVPILDEPDDAALIDGFQFGAKAQDARTLALDLDANAYIAVRITLDIARGARQGDITLILPTLEARAEQPDEDLSDLEAGAPKQGTEITKLVMGLNAELQMVLCQLNVPLSKLNALDVGETLELTPGAFPNVKITTLTGRVVGRGLVGHVDGVRAVKPIRAPLHAAQPLRRASDKPLVDMPEVEVLTSSGRRTTVSREVDVSAAELAEAMSALPPIPERRASVEDFDAVGGVPDIPFPVEEDFGDNGDLPELGDLPNLEDMPDLAAMPDLSATPDPEPLPDLDGLPDLDDLPDLADLPDLDMQAAG